MAIPAKLKAMVGKSNKTPPVEVEKGQVRRFALSIGEDNPIHIDEKAAKAAGFASLVAPPTFPSALFRLDHMYEDLGLDSNATMHAEEEYEYFRPIVAGDIINLNHRLVNAYDKQAPNGRLIFIVVETRGTDKRNRQVFKARRVLVELKT